MKKQKAQRPLLSNFCFPLSTPTVVFVPGAMVPGLYPDFPDDFLILVEPTRV